MIAFASALLIATPAAAANPYRGLWTDWGAANRARAEAERSAPAPRHTEEEARALGTRVGEVVAQGDCRNGERLALEAGDMRLVEAVRRHCAMPRLDRPRR
jgi:hypothetical protein